MQIFKIIQTVSSLFVNDFIKICFCDSVDCLETKCHDFVDCREVIDNRLISELSDEDKLRLHKCAVKCGIFIVGISLGIYCIAPLDIQQAFICLPGYIPLEEFEMRNLKSKPPFDLKESDNFDFTSWAFYLTPTILGLCFSLYLVI